MDAVAAAKREQGKLTPVQPHGSLSAANTLLECASIIAENEETQSRIQTTQASLADCELQVALLLTQRRVCSLSQDSKHRPVFGNSDLCAELACGLSASQQFSVPKAQKC